MDIIKLYLDPSHAVFYALIATPLVALAVFLLKSKGRVVAIAAFTCLPTLLFIGVILFSLPKLGFPIDFQKHNWVGMGMAMIPAYNLFWIPPAMLGWAIGKMALWIKQKAPRSGIRDIF